MKTAMQELIERFESYQTIRKLENEHREINVSINLDDIIYLLKETLSIEKQQIIDFHLMLIKKGLEQEGNTRNWNNIEFVLKDEAEEYYNQTYNNGEN
jgi:hypothetical protein